MTTSLTAAPGTVAYRSLRFEGHNLPLVIAAGRRPGPVLAVVGVQHATEYTGPAALDRVLDTLDLDRMDGTLIGLPFVNPLQIRLTREEFARTWKKPQTNLNRQWPGEANSRNPLSRLAAFVWNTVLAHANAVLDFHCCRTVDPRFAAALDGHQAGVELAAALGLEAVDLQTADSYAPGVLVFALPDRLNIPAALIESHPAGFQVRESVDACAGAVFRAMAHLGMARPCRPARASPARMPVFHRAESGHAVKARRTGYLGVRRWAGEGVRKGEVLAVVRSLDTFAVVEELKSPADGAVGSCGVSANDALVRPGDVAATVKRVDWIRAPRSLFPTARRDR